MYIAQARKVGEGWEVTVAGGNGFRRRYEDLTAGRVHADLARALGSYEESFDLRFNQDYATRGS
jgi:hypothetical protein